MTGSSDSPPARSPLREQTDLLGSGTRRAERRTTICGGGSISVAYRRETLARANDAPMGDPVPAIGRPYLAIGSTVCCGGTGAQNRRMRKGEPTGSRVTK